MSQISKMALVLAVAAASLALTFAFGGCNKSAPDNTAQTQPAAAPGGQNQDRAPPPLPTWPPFPPSQRRTINSPQIQIISSLRIQTINRLQTIRITIHAI